MSNIFNIYLKLIQICILKNEIKKNKIRYIISNALPTSVESKIFNYISRELKIRYCCFITKVICKNNLGYKFEKNIKLYSNFYFINSNKTKEILEINKYTKINYYLFKHKNYKKFKINLKNNKSILIVFTRNKNENEVLIKILEFIYNNTKNIKIYYKFHPQGDVGNEIRNYLKNLGVNISSLSNRKIDEIFKKKQNKKFVITSFSSYVCKILHLGFIPIWIQGFKELDFLFRDITENLGYQIITDKNLSSVKANIMRLLKKNNSNIYKKNYLFNSNYLKLNDFKFFLKNIEKYYVR